MSKAHDPHWRYVAFRAEGDRPVPRRAMQNALMGRFRSLGWSDEELPQLTRFDWPHGIVRVGHRRLADCRTGLPKMDWAVDGRDRVGFQVRTLSSSGTLKALTTRLDVLKQRAGAGPKAASGPARATGGVGRGATGEARAPPGNPRRGGIAAPRGQGAVRNPER